MQVQMKITALEQLTVLTDELKQQLQAWAIGEEKQMDLRLCLMEAVQNALLHGRRRVDTPASVEVRWRCTEQGFCFCVQDDGHGVPIGLRTQSWNDVSLEEHGRGLLLMQAILDELSFNEEGNCINGWMKW